MSRSGFPESAVRASGSSDPLIPEPESSGGVVGLKRPDLRLLLRRSGLLRPTSTSIQVRTFRLWYYLGLPTPPCLHIDSSRKVEHFGRAAVQMNLPKGTSRSLISIQ